MRSMPGKRACVIEATLLCTNLFSDMHHTPALSCLLCHPYIPHLLYLLVTTVLIQMRFFTVLGEDFVVGESTTLELTTLGSSQCFIVSLVNDDVRESNETIVITPVPLDPDDNVVGGHFTIVILDDGDGEK